jgi:hypothetical protein
MTQSRNARLLVGDLFALSLRSAITSCAPRRSL